MIKEPKPLDEKTAKMVELWNAGLSGNEIAKQLGITKNVVVGKVHRARIAGHDVKVKGTGGNNKTSKPDKKQIKRRPKVTKAEKPSNVIKLLPFHFVPKTVVPGHIEIQDLSQDQCKYPMRQSKAGIWLFCGEHTNSTYCKKHHAMCYDTERSKRKA